MCSDFHKKKKKVENALRTNSAVLRTDLAHFMRRETQKVTPVWIFCHHKSRPFKMHNNFKDKIKTRHIYQLYLRCGGVGVSQRRVSHGSKKIRQKETGAQIRGDIQQHPCQKSTFASETSSERVSANFFLIYLFLYHQPAYPNGEHAHIYAPLSILRAAKTVFKSNFSAVLAVPPHSRSCCSVYSVPAVLQSKASVCLCVCA